jgi:hypothetical protein
MQTYLIRFRYPECVAVPHTDYEDYSFEWSYETLRVEAISEFHAGIQFGEVADKYPGYTGVSVELAPELANAYSIDEEF